MAVRKIRGWWYVDLRAGRRTRYRKKSPENSRAGAQAYELVLRQRLARAEPIGGKEAQPAPTFADFASRWFREYVEVNTKPSTRHGYDQALKCHLIPFFGRSRLSEIGTEDIERFKTEKRRAGLSPKTINTRLSVLRRCLDTAHEWGYLSTLPRFKWLKVPPPSFDHLAPSESARLLAASASSRWHLVVRCALRTGMRLGELLALRWEDVDLERRRIVVCRALSAGVVCSPKNNRTRFVPLTSDLAEALAAAQPEGEYVFTGILGAPRCIYTAEEALKRICKRAGLRGIGWHVLRHTFASQLASEGVPLRLVQQLLGHSTIVMTERYAHLAPSVLDQVVEVLLDAERRDLAKMWAAGGHQLVDKRVGEPLRLLPGGASAHEGTAKVRAENNETPRHETKRFLGSPKGNRSSRDCE